MNKFKFKSFMVFTILLVMLMMLLIVSDQTSATVAEIKPVSNSLLFTPSKTSGVETNQLPPIAPGVVLVGLKPGITVSTGRLGVQASDASLSTTFSDIGVQNIEPVFADTSGHLLAASTNTEIDMSRIYRLRLAPDADVLRVVQELNTSPAVVYAEPDYLAHIIATPNDPLYSGQWGLSQINAPAAWDVITGTTDVVIAVIDSGLDTSHPDLAGQLWTNPGEIAGNSIDDDNNGYVDDINGWNLVDDDMNLSDNTGHGTQVAGVVAAATNNGEGVAGVCWNCRLMVVKVTQPGGVANYSDIAAGVTYAAQKGADVINLSLGGYSDSATLRAAVEAASQTAVVVGGAGNDDKSDPFYPAAYDDYVLAVAGTTSGDTKVGTSSYGTWVDVSAPGETITTTFSGGGYGVTSGTSMAAPFAAGLAGLLRSQYPGWSANQVRAQIVQTTDDIDGLNPGYAGELGSGRIDANQAVATAAQPLLGYQSHSVDGETNGRPKPGSTVDLDVTLTNEWADATNVQATLSTSDSYVTVVNATASYGSIAAYDSGTNATSFRFSVSGSAPYAHAIPFTLNVTADGEYATTVPFTVTTASGVEYVSGILFADTTWINEKTYTVNEDVGVATGVTLTIQPGTEIRFDGFYKLQVAGTLIADGTQEQPIRLTSNKVPPAPGDWVGLRFTDSSQDAVLDPDNNYLAGCILRYVVIEFANRAVDMVQASPYVAYNHIWKNASEGIYGDYGSPYVSSNYVEQNRSWGILTHYDGSPTVLKNRVVDNGQGIYVGYFMLGSPLVEGNLIASNSGVGIHRAIFGESMRILHNTVIDNSGVGLRSDSGSVGTIISGCNILRNLPYDASLGYDSVDGQKDITATLNYWGTTSAAVIDEHLYDMHDDMEVGIIHYTPFLSVPGAFAPAFLWQLDLSPASPVGIQTVTFDLTFSRSMDQSSDPTVAFGATEPYTTYQVVDNPQWLDASHWRATYDVTSLVPRGTYTISVSSAKGTDGMDIPTDTRFGFTVDYAGEITDQTPPNSPSVIAGGKEGDASTVEAMWSASDPDSSITGYRYAIGSAPGATDIVNWTDTSNSFITRSGLGLLEGRQYWLAVRARNEGGLWSTSGFSAFVAGQPSHRVFLPLVIRNQ